jgi:hypothetical protein
MPIPFFCEKMKRFYAGIEEKSGSFIIAIRQIFSVAEMSANHGG